MYIGIKDEHWSLINSLHSNATASIKWNNYISVTFTIQQGIRQGGVLSADLYKIYIDSLWYVACLATACADDITFDSAIPEDAQPAKSAILEIGKHINTISFRMGETVMPIENKATHLGIQRATSTKETITLNVNENLKKARIYFLLHYMVKMVLILKHRYI
jgi:hypothetical protein